MAELINRATLAGSYNDVTPMTIATQLTIEMVDISIVKTADRAVWGGDEPLTYTVTINNNDTNPVTDPTFTDTLEFEKVRLVDGSVEVDGVTVEDYVYNPATGVLTLDLENLLPGEGVTVSFRVTKV